MNNIKQNDNNSCSEYMNVGTYPLLQTLIQILSILNPYTSHPTRTRFFCLSSTLGFTTPRAWLRLACFSRLAVAGSMRAMSDPSEGSNCCVSMVSASSWRLWRVPDCSLARLMKMWRLLSSRVAEGTGVGGRPDDFSEPACQMKRCDQNDSQQKKRKCRI